MIDLSIITVSYNTEEFIKECIVSIKNNFKGFNFEIIVVDNGSSDNSVKMLRQEFPEVTLIENKKNLGFSKANNIGIKKSRGRYVLFLNPDTIVEKNSLSRMIKFMDGHMDAGAATCRLVMKDGRLDDAAHRGFPSPWNSFSYFSGLSKIFPKSRLFSGYHMGWFDTNRTHIIDACAGAFMIVQREAGEKIGWWDEDYFFYGEDLEFCFRLRESGYRVYFVADAEALHYKGVSGGIKIHSKKITTASIETKRLATDWRFEAMRIFYKKHYEKSYPKPISFIVMTAINLKHQLALNAIKT